MDKHTSIMKLFYATLLILISGCTGTGTFTEQSKYYGNWEMTEYDIDGVIIDNEEAFINTSIRMKKFGAFTNNVIVTRDENPCDQTHPLGLSISKNGMTFSQGETCDTLNKIDPHFYETNDTSNNGVSGQWSIEYKNKRIFILNNENFERQNKIRIIFEKVK